MRLYRLLGADAAKASRLKQLVKEFTMIESYLNIYGPLVAFGLLALSSVMLFLRGYSGPSILIGTPSALLMLLKAIVEFAGPGSVGYVHDHEGDILGATGAFSVWQQAMFRVYPVAILAIAVGALWLASSLPHLNKPLKSNA